MSDWEEQPAPVNTGHPSGHELAQKRLAERARIGLERYGAPLEPFNGRDVLRDLAEEISDAAAYVECAILEMDTLRAERDNLTREYADAVDYGNRMRERAERAEQIVAGLQFSAALATEERNRAEAALDRVQALDAVRIGVGLYVRLDEIRAAIEGN